jgi:hypothetical protein
LRFALPVLGRLANGLWRVDRVPVLRMAIDAADAIGIKAL